MLQMESDLLIEANPRILESCKNHLFINQTRAQVNTNKLRVKMNGNLEFIYDALLVPLSNLLKSMLNEELQ